LIYSNVYMNQKTVHIKSFGCQMNKLDTTLVTSALEEEGFRLSDSVKQADVVLINTCSVRDHAEQRVLSHLGHLKHIKETRPALVVGVIGCMAQRLGPELLEHEAVDIVCGPTQIPQVTTLVVRALAEKNKALAVTEKIRTQTGDDQADALEQFESVFGIENKRIPSQAFVRVMRGCNKFCTYCVVPYVRGPEVSRPPTAIIEQIKRVADHGVKQITLLGQTVNSYQYTAGEKTYCLADILEMASDVNGIQWIRFVTSYPSNEFFDETLHAMASLPTRAIVPDIALSSDFIVGFPNETDDDFQATVDLLKKARYKNSFIFKYSPRAGTPADQRLEDNVPAEVKKKRNIELLAVQEKISDQLSRAFLGKTVQALVEGLSKKPHLDAAQSPHRPQLVARTAADFIVVLNGPESLTGHFANVKITKTAPLTLFGKLL
jgi:tRNA-2-methylthio-N6-dimethylallyladenosine synthase